MNWKLAGLILALGLLVPAAWADSAYPSRPVKLVVGFAPGDPTDLLTRITAPALAQFFKQRFIIDNHVGASGNVAAALVAKAQHDGHTLLVVSVHFATSI